METEKIVVVKKSTLLESLLKRHTTTSQARFYLESAGQSYEFYQQDHKNYHENLKEVVRNIPRTIRTQTIDKDDLSMFKFSNKDLVVAFGDDGLLVNLAKYVGNQPIIFVNADEKRFDGVLATCTTKEFQKALEEKLQDKTYLESLTMAEANLNNGETFYALNDLFIGKKTHVSAKYDIKHNGKEEYQSSSGIVVSTGTGSTGWLTSFATWCKEVCEKEFPYAVPFSRESDSLIFTVREPFPTKITGTSIVVGEITEENPLMIYSKMPEEGVIFSDGIEKDYVEFNSGRTATIKPSTKKVNLVRLE